MITIADEFIHSGADSRQYLVVHGDQFDNVERYARWLSMLGSSAYEFLIWMNNVVNIVRRRMRLNDCRLSSRAKVLVKSAVRFISDFEQRLVEAAQMYQCDGVICGHIHTPRMSQIGDILYCNTGDWVEHCTAMVEYKDGRMELVEHSRLRSRVRTSVRTTCHDPESESVDASLVLASSVQEVIQFLTRTDRFAPKAAGLDG
jgi:UDP-2,3-diacylglucosamine pyrophosphatase LpxH